MTVTELVERLKAVKVKDTEVIFRNPEGKTLTIGGMYYGVMTDNVVAHPQIGDEPNCVIVAVADTKTE
jgi:hypothetical protein